METKIHLETKNHNREPNELLNEWVTVFTSLYEILGYLIPEDAGVNLFSFSLY